MSDHTPETAAPPRRGALALGATAALSGLVLFLSFPPADLGPLGFFAFVPLLVVIRGARTTAACAAYGAVAAACAYVPAFAWVAPVTIAGWPALALYVGLYLVVGVVLIRYLSRRFPALWPVMAACLWTGLELFRARLGPGFPWLFLGYTQYRFGALLQIAAWAGVYGLSFLVFWCNAGIASLVRSLLQGERVRWLHPALPLLAVALCAMVGQRVRGGLVTERGPVVGAVQQNVARRRSEIFGRARSAEETYAALEDEMARALDLTLGLAGRAPAMVVWPETTVPVALNVAPGALRPGPRRLLGIAFDHLQKAVSTLDCPLLVGAPMLTQRPARADEIGVYGPTVTGYANSAVFVSSEGKIQGRYDKVHLVPFGEYVPWVDALPFLQAFTPFTRNLTAGKEMTLFSLPDGERGAVPFSALICYEDVFPSLVRDFRLKGARFFVNVTDEGWYSIPGELGQHLAMAVFRAVETRTTVVRAANTGITCFIGPRGEVYRRLPQGTKGALAAPVRLCDARTLYMRLGDAFAIVCLMLAIALPGLLAALRRR